MIEKSTSCLLHHNVIIIITAIDRNVIIFYHNFCYAYLTKDFRYMWKENPLGFGCRHQCMTLSFEKRSFCNAFILACIVNIFIVLFIWPCTWSKPHLCTLHVCLNSRNRTLSRKIYHDGPNDSIKWLLTPILYFYSSALTCIKLDSSVCQTSEIVAYNWRSWIFCSSSKDIWISISLGLISSRFGESLRLNVMTTGSWDGTWESISSNNLKSVERYFFNINCNLIMCLQVVITARQLQ